MTKADYVWVILAITLLYFLWSGHRIDCPPWRLMLAALALGIVRRGRTTRNGNQERRGETSGPWRIRQMGEKTPQRRQDDGRLSLLPVLTERKVGPSRFPSGWRQVANRSRLASGSAGRLESHHRRAPDGRPRLNGQRRFVSYEPPPWVWAGRRHWWPFRAAG